MRKPILAAAAAISMIGLTGGAVAQSAAPLSLNAAPLSLDASVRAGADTAQASDIRGGFILPTLALIGIGLAVYFLTRNNSPASP